MRPTPKTNISYYVTLFLFNYKITTLKSNLSLIFSFFFFLNDTATPEISPLPLHDALPICLPGGVFSPIPWRRAAQDSPAEIARSAQSGTAGARTPRPSGGARAGRVQRSGQDPPVPPPQIGRAHV